MNAALPEFPVRAASLARSRLATRLRRVIKGQVLFDESSRGRYSTDASIHQVRPLGVVVPADELDLQAAVEIAAELRVPMLSRGAGTSMGGQSLAEALIIDCSRLDRVMAIDAAGLCAEVQPGVVLDRLNAALKPLGLWFPVDVAGSAVATVGGMAGNNSAGTRSLFYGNMVHNVIGIDAILADGSGEHFGAFGVNVGRPLARGRSAELVSQLFTIGDRERDEIERAWPRVAWHAGVYNLDIFHPQSARAYTADGSVNLSHLLVGSEGTLAHFRRIHLKLAPLPAVRVLGVVGFSDLAKAMTCTASIAALRPAAIELVDRALVDVLRNDPVFRPVIEPVFSERVRPSQAAWLLVEFAGDSWPALLAQLRDLARLIGDRGHQGALVEVLDERTQRVIWKLREAGLNKLMSSNREGRAIHFIEDCVLPLEHLAEFTARMDDVLRRHASQGVWWGHAGAGALQVRLLLERSADGAIKMRAIAEETAELVRRFNGWFSISQVDGLARSDWASGRFGQRLARAFEEVKDLFDPHGLLAPGKIVRVTRMGRRDRARAVLSERVREVDTGFDWSLGLTMAASAVDAFDSPGPVADSKAGFAAAAERCDGNGRCRVLEGGVMCPSFRVLRQEQHSPRGRANTLRLALSGQLGDEALVSAPLFETLSTCVGCKACRSECANGVDISRMKLEFLHQSRKRHGLPLRERLIAALPRYAGLASRLAPLVNGLADLPGSAWLRERLLGLSAARRLPRWNLTPFTRDEALSSHTHAPGPHSRAVVIWADTFNNYFEPEVLRAARRVLEAAGKSVILARASPHDPEPGRPLCCGRTWLATGQIERARAELRRTLDALSIPGLAELPLVGLEPACLFTFRDEALALGLGERAEQLAVRSFMFEEYLARERSSGQFDLALKEQAGVAVHCHAHCHQKAFGTSSHVAHALMPLPGATIHAIEAGCCGMAGAFGFQAETRAFSEAMAALELTPALAALPEDAIVVADGTSCRQMIRESGGRRAWHVAQVLDRAISGRLSGRP